MAINTIILASVAAGASLRGANVPSGGLKPCVQSYQYAASGSTEQFGKLNDVAMKAFSVSSVERGNATSSVWTGLPNSFGSQEMMCSIVESVFNTVHAVGSLSGLAVGKEQKASFNTQIFFQQADRDSCGNSAVAAVLAQSNPERMVSLLSTLYWQGTLTTDTGSLAKYQPRPYSLQLEQQKACRQQQTTADNWCQNGATFIWTVATRDAWNVEILTTDRYNTLEVQKHSKISATFVHGAASQGGNGASYNSASGLITGLLSMLDTESENKPVKVIQGACSTFATAAEQQTCRDGLNGLLPSELTSLKSWFTNHFPAIRAAIFLGPEQHPSEVPSYDGWSPNVRAKVDDKMLWLKQYYTPVQTAEIQNVCKQQQKSHNSHPVILAVNDQVVGGPNGHCTSGFCMANHWVVLETNTCDDMCTVWTWGYTQKIHCAELARYTTTIVHGF